MVTNGSDVTMYGKHGVVEDVNSLLSIAKISFDTDGEGNKVATDGWYGFKYQDKEDGSNVIWICRQFS